MRRMSSVPCGVNERTPWLDQHLTIVLERLEYRNKVQVEYALWRGSITVEALNRVNLNEWTRC
jgi:hypothetical protein